MTDDAAERFLASIRAVARDCGYAIAVHGSQRPERDLDLAAIPWTPEATSADQLVATLLERIPLAEVPHETQPVVKSWGRLAWSLAGCPAHQYVDLSVAPRAGEPVPHHTGLERTDKIEKE